LVNLRFVVGADTATTPPVAKPCKVEEPETPAESCGDPGAGPSNAAPPEELESAVAAAALLASSQDASVDPAVVGEMGLHAVLSRLTGGYRELAGVAMTWVDKVIKERDEKTSAERVRGGGGGGGGVRTRKKIVEMKAVEEEDEEEEEEEEESHLRRSKRQRGAATGTVADSSSTEGAWH
jgi:hypothetical protein